MAVRRSSHTAGQGVHGEPAYVLHRYEWSESSLILELFTRNLGRVAVAAKGVRKPASAFRSVLLPFQPLLVSLGPQAQIRTLRGAEWAGGYAMPTGEPLLVGYYVNELLMRLLAREDVQPLVFDAYAQTLAFIAKHSGEKVAEKRRLCRCWGKSCRMREISGRNPMSSMRSASSSTTIST